jgi:hypothetical protein
MELSVTPPLTSSMTGAGHRRVRCSDWFSGRGEQTSDNLMLRLSSDPTLANVKARPKPEGFAG